MSYGFMDSDEQVLEVVLRNNGLDRLLFSRPSGSFTIFAPTAEVFKAAEASLESLSPERRRALLLYHVVAEDYPSTVVERLFAEGARVKTLDDGAALHFSKSDRGTEPSHMVGRIFENDIVATDRFITNRRGERTRVRVHFIDRVLMPRDEGPQDIKVYSAAKMPQKGPPGTVKERLLTSRERPNAPMRAGELVKKDEEAQVERFYGELRDAGLTKELFADGCRRYTVLAPTAAAFDAARTELRDLERTELAELLAYHVLVGDVSGDDLKKMFVESRTLMTTGPDDATLELVSEADTVRLGKNDADGRLYADELVAADIELVDKADTRNVVRVHLIARVLVPLEEDGEDEEDEEGNEEESANRRACSARRARSPSKRRARAKRTKKWKAKKEKRKIWTKKTWKTRKAKRTKKTKTSKSQKAKHAVVADAQVAMAAATVEAEDVVAEAAATAAAIVRVVHLVVATAEAGATEEVVATAAEAATEAAATAAAAHAVATASTSGRAASTSRPSRATRAWHSRRRRSTRSTRRR